MLELIAKIAAEVGNELDRVEQAVVRQCLRQLMGTDQATKIGSRETLVRALMSYSDDIKEIDARNYTYTANVRQVVWTSLSESALNILADNVTKIIEFYQAANLQILRLVCYLFLTYRNSHPAITSDLQLIRQFAGQEDSSSRSIRRIIFDNWTRLSKVGHGSLQTGLYQSFRRYKPTREQKLAINPSIDWSKDENHVVVCELLYLDLENLECKMVTGDLNVYHGTLNITYEDILYAIMQRPARQYPEIHQRFFASRIEGADLGVYCGLLMKIGNLTTRPIAAGTYYLFIDREAHRNLYTAFDEILEKKWEDTNPISKDSLIADYIAITPPVRLRTHPDWARVKFLKDFPGLLKMGQPSANYIALFREPLRTLGALTLSEVLSDVSIDVFRQSDAEPPS